MKNYLVFLIMFLALLVGCAPKTWHKDGATQSDYEKDKLACKKEANSAGYGHNVFNVCMNSRGYSMEKKQTTQ